MWYGTLCCWLVLAVVWLCKNATALDEGIPNLQEMTNALWANPVGSSLDPSDSGALPALDAMLVLLNSQRLNKRSPVTCPYCPADYPCAPGCPTAPKERNKRATNCEQYNCPQNDCPKSDCPPKDCPKSDCQPSTCEPTNCPPKDCSNCFGRIGPKGHRGPKGIAYYYKGGIIQSGRKGEPGVCSGLRGPPGPPGIPLPCRPVTNTTIDESEIYSSFYNQYRCQKRPNVSGAYSFKMLLIVVYFLTN